MLQKTIVNPGRAFEAVAVVEDAVEAMADRALMKVCLGIHFMRFTD